jgi:hypothetical protein
MWCLTLATNAIVCWSTEYHGLGVAALRRTGRENVHFYGTHSVDIDGELAQLDTDGYRPLRLAQVARQTADGSGRRPARHDAGVHP